MLTVFWLRVWSPVRVEAVRVDRAMVIHEAFGRGTIESQREAAVGFDLVGRLSEVLVEEGVRVTLGQELARLQTDQAQADLRSAQRGVSAARTSLLRLSADEQRVRALLLAAERENARAQTLFSSGAIASLQRDEANDRLRLAHADLDRVLAQRSEATRGIDVAAGGAEQRRVTMVRATPPCALRRADHTAAARARRHGHRRLDGAAHRRHQPGVCERRDRRDGTPAARRRSARRHRLSGRQAPSRGAALEDPWEADRQTHELIVEVRPNASSAAWPSVSAPTCASRLGAGRTHFASPRGRSPRQAGSFVYADRGGRIAVVRPRFGLTGADHVEVSAGLAEATSFSRRRDRPHPPSGAALWVTR
ncbi:MAG: hypothetical protein U0325_31465 [Polyangiales bacterium]